MTNTMQTAKELTFGTELEYTNISRERAVKAIHSVVGGTIHYTGGGYDEWTVIAPDGRHWKAVSEADTTNGRWSHRTDATGKRSATEASEAVPQAPR